MQKGDLVLKVFVRPEIFVYIAIAVFTGAFFLLSSYGQSGGQDVLKHYVNLNAPRMVWTAMLFFIGLFVHVVVLWTRAMIKQVDPATVFTQRNVARTFRGMRAVFKNLAVVGIPFVLAFYSLGMAIGKLNVFNSTRLRDELLFRFDTILTGTFPPLTLASFHYPSWFVVAVDFSFFHLVPVLTVFGAYLFYCSSAAFSRSSRRVFPICFNYVCGMDIVSRVEPERPFCG